MKIQFIWRVPLAFVTAILCMVSLFLMGNIEGYAALLFTSFIVTLGLFAVQMDRIQVLWDKISQFKRQLEADKRFEQIRKDRIILSYNRMVTNYQRNGFELKNIPYINIYTELAQNFMCYPSEIKRIVLQHKIALRA